MTIRHLQFYIRLTFVVVDVHLKILKPLKSSVTLCTRISSRMFTWIRNRHKRYIAPVNRINRNHLKVWNCRLNDNNIKLTFTHNTIPCTALVWFFRACFDVKCLRQRGQSYRVLPFCCCFFLFASRRAKFGGLFLRGVRGALGSHSSSSSRAILLLKL